MKKKAVIDTTLCVACGCCIKACPLGAVSVPLGIYAVVVADKCAGCGKCAVKCPASVITIEKEEADYAEKMV